MLHTPRVLDETPRWLANVYLAVVVEGCGDFEEKKEHGMPMGKRKRHDSRHIHEEAGGAMDLRQDAKASEQLSPRYTPCPFRLLISP